MGVAVLVVLRGLVIRTLRCGTVSSVASKEGIVVNGREAIADRCLQTAKPVTHSTAVLTKLLRQLPKPARFVNRYSKRLRPNFRRRLERYNEIKNAVIALNSFTVEENQRSAAKLSYRNHHIDIRR